ncbi:MAG: hypothetical protein RI947_1043 [Candidatus Parcubacteria bacterium]|jgi:hypothetical protein
MKKFIIPSSLLLTAVFVTASSFGSVFAVTRTSDALRGRSGERQLDVMRAERKENEEATPEAKPTRGQGSQMACTQVKTKLPERAELLKLRKEVHLKVYANLKINMKRRMMARNMSETAINEALAGLDKLITQFSTDVDALMAKMMDASKLDCTNETALTTFRESLKLLERTVKADVKAIMEYYTSTLKTLNAKRRLGRPTGTEATKAPTVMPTAVTTTVPSATAAATTTVSPTPSL